MRFKILIPTYNRPAFLRRILNYYDSFNKNIGIIVADSSFLENKHINKKTVSSCCSLDILYLDQYQPEIHPHLKIADAVNYFDGQYAVICADDDFMAPEGINASIDFLEKNPDFSAAHGRYISFYLKNKKNKKPDFLWRPTYHENSILSPDVAERMANHVKNYKPTFYAVHRSDFIKMIFGEVARSGINPFLFGEMLPSMITAVYGKIKNLNVFYAAKQKFSSFGGSWPTLTNAMKQGTYNEEYQKFKDCLVYHLRKNSFLEEDQLKSSVDNSMSGYLNRYYLTADYKKEIADKLGISSRLYKKIRIFSKTILGLNKNMWRESFKGTGLDNFSVELERIRGIVLSSDENEAKSLS